MTARYVAAVAMLVACNDPNPPLIGDCTSRLCTPVLSTGGGLSDASCGLSSAVQSCQSCLVSACCAVDEACAANAACVALIDCLNTCATTDAAICPQYCADTNDGGINPYNDLANCVQASCNGACN